MDIYKYSSVSFTWVKSATVAPSGTNGANKFAFSLSLYRSINAGIEIYTIAAGAPGADKGYAIASNPFNSQWSITGTFNGETGSNFGSSSAIYDNIIAFGAPQGTSTHMAGAIFTYEAYNNGSVVSWKSETTILPSAPSNVTGSNFGSSVSLFGLQLACGASALQQNPQGNGAAYLYIRSVSAVPTHSPSESPTFAMYWREEAVTYGAPNTVNFGSIVSIKDEVYAVSNQTHVDLFDIYNAAAGTNKAIYTLNSTDCAFGISLALGQYTIVVGAISCTYTNYSVHMYSYTYGEYFAITENEVWTMSSPTPIPTLTSFGNAVALYEGADFGIEGAVPVTVVIADELNETVYVYTAPDAKNPMWSTAYPISDPDFNSNFGKSVAIYSNTIAIGADSSSGEGVVYIFEYIADVWEQKKTLEPADGLDTDMFGASLAIYGEYFTDLKTELIILVVGAPTYAKAYIYDEDPTGEFKHVETLLGATGSQFGASVASDADMILVGAPLSSSATGVVYIYVPTSDAEGNPVFQLMQQVTYLYF